VYAKFCGKRSFPREILSSPPAAADSDDDRRAAAGDVMRFGEKPEKIRATPQFGAAIQ
jgi:hypothetical protein